jgi:hypothetical protein
MTLIYPFLFSCNTAADTAPVLFQETMEERTSIALEQLSAILCSALGTSGDRLEIEQSNIGGRDNLHGMEKNNKTAKHGKEHVLQRLQEIQDLSSVNPALLWEKIKVATERPRRPVHEQGVVEGGLLIPPSPVDATVATANDAYKWAGLLRKFPAASREVSIFFEKSEQNRDSTTVGQRVSSHSEVVSLPILKVVSPQPGPQKDRGSRASSHSEGVQQNSDPSPSTRLAPDLLETNADSNPIARLTPDLLENAVHFLLSACASDCSLMIAIGRMNPKTASLWRQERAKKGIPTLTHDLPRCLCDVHRAGCSDSHTEAEDTFCSQCHTTIVRYGGRASSWAVCSVKLADLDLKPMSKFPHWVRHETDILNSFTSMFTPGQDIPFCSLNRTQS